MKDLTEYSEHYIDPRLPQLDWWGPATIFDVPLSEDEPKVIHSDGTGWGPGIRASIFRQTWQEQLEHKYTRGHCHEFAAALVEEHGGRIISLMSRGRVAHVMAFYEFPEGRVLRDINGEFAFPGHEPLVPDDFEFISDVYLLGCPIHEVIITDPEPWTLPCLPPDPAEIIEARGLLAVRGAPAWPDELKDEPTETDEGPAP